ncbi:hypothetical protein GN109_05825 [Collimonas pratensis]|uniref:hypothetical protein n=1 Tax=Collimonas pratensis TaxID=279113 RepID=UPI00143CF4F6|nr:hypothetical protein [Collimonas pratensis]NKI68932.1 hypothetical protein [Collimonas pratensis]
MTTECARYEELLALQQAGVIKDLRRQVAIGDAASKCVIDFQYVHVGSNCLVSEDMDPELETK